MARRQGFSAFRSRSLVCLSLSLLLLLFLGSQAQAMTVTYGSSTIHTNSVTNGYITVTLDPDPISDGGVFLTTSPSTSFINAMTQSLAAADWWGSTITTFNYVGTLNGTLNIEVYNAAIKSTYTGGAQLLATYTRGAGDPAANSLFWIQVVTTNKPNGGETIPYPDVYFSPYAAGQKLPFYYTPAETVLDANPYTTPGQPNIYSSNFTYGPDNIAITYDISFWDWPSRTPNATWRGELFLATYDAADKYVEIFEGINWGFDVSGSPLPPSLFLLLTGLPVVLWRSRRKSDSAK